MSSPLLYAPTFVDASAWIALLHPRDRHHYAAQAVYRQFMHSEVLLITTNWVVYEGLTLLKSRMGSQHAEQLWEIANDPMLVSLARVTDAVEAVPLRLFFEYQDKTWGVVDCTSFVVMAETGCRQAFGFDQQFREAGQQRGFRVVPENSASL